MQAIKTKGCPLLSPAPQNIEPAFQGFSGATQRGKQLLDIEVGAQPLLQLGHPFPAQTTHQAVSGKHDQVRILRIGEGHHHEIKTFLPGIRGMKGALFLLVCQGCLVAMVPVGNIDSLVSKELSHPSDGFLVAYYPNIIGYPVITHSTKGRLIQRRIIK